MNKQKIISLLDEAITVLSESEKRRLNGEERRKFQLLLSLILHENKRRLLLSEYAEDFHGCVGIACVGVFDRRVLRGTLKGIARGVSDARVLRSVQIFLRALHEEISSYGLHSSLEFRRLANVGAQSESFAHVKS